MKSSIMPISDSDSTCQTPNQQRKYLFKNYTNIPSLNEEELFSEHCGQDNGYEHYANQVRFLKTQIRALQEFHKTINEEIQFLVLNFRYIIELAGKNISNKILSFKLDEQKCPISTLKFQGQQKMLTRKIQLLQADLKNEKESNKSLKEEILRYKYTLKTQSKQIEGFKKMINPYFSNENCCKTITDEDIISIEKVKTTKNQSWIQQGSNKTKQGLRWSGSGDQEEVDRLGKMRERCKILKEQLQNSKQQLIDYN